MARIRVTNLSKREGVVWVDDVDHDDEDRARRILKVPAGGSIDVHASQRGIVYVQGFEASLVAVPKRIRKPEKPTPNKRERASRG
jgi:hypothetical protein